MWPNNERNDIFTEKPYSLAKIRRDYLSTMLVGIFVFSLIIFILLFLLINRNPVRQYGISHQPLDIVVGFLMILLFVISLLLLPYVILRFYVYNFSKLKNPFKVYEDGLKINGSADFRLIRRTKSLFIPYSNIRKLIYVHPSRYLLRKRKGKYHKVAIFALMNENNSEHDVPRTPILVKRKGEKHMRGAIQIYEGYTDNPLLMEEILRTISAGNRIELAIRTWDQVILNRGRVE